VTPVARLFRHGWFAPPIRQAGSAAETRVRVRRSPGLSARLANVHSPMRITVAISSGRTRFRPTFSHVQASKRPKIDLCVRGAERPRAIPPSLQLVCRFCSPRTDRDAAFRSAIYKNFRPHGSSSGANAGNGSRGLMLDSAARRTPTRRAAVQRSHIYGERKGRLLREPSLCRGPTSWLPLSGPTNCSSRNR